MNARHHLTLALQYCQARRWRRAFEEFGTAIDMDNNLKEAYFYRGRLYNDMICSEKACEDLLIAIRIDPNYTEAYKELVRAYLCQSWLVPRDNSYAESALEIANKLLAIDPTDIDMLSRRASAYNYLQKYKLAKQDCDQAISLNPQHSDARYERCRANSGLNLPNLIYPDLVELCESSDDVFKVFELLKAHDITLKYEKVITYCKKLKNLRDTYHLTYDQATSFETIRLWLLQGCRQLILKQDMNDNDLPSALPALPSEVINHINTFVLERDDSLTVNFKKMICDQLYDDVIKHKPAASISEKFGNIQRKIYRLFTSDNKPVTWDEMQNDRLAMRKL